MMMMMMMMMTYTESDTDTLSDRVIKSRVNHNERFYRRFIGRQHRCI